MRTSVAIREHEAGYTTLRNELKDREECDPYLGELSGILVGSTFSERTPSQSFRPRKRKLDDRPALPTRQGAGRRLAVLDNAEKSTGSGWWHTRNLSARLVCLGAGLGTVGALVHFLSYTLPYFNPAFIGFYLFTCVLFPGSAKAECRQDPAWDQVAVLMKQIRLRYAGTCRLCGAPLAPGTEAVYETETKMVRCLTCVSEVMSPGSRTTRRGFGGVRNCRGVGAT